LSIAYPSFERPDFAPQQLWQQRQPVLMLALHPLCSPVQPYLLKSPKNLESQRSPGLELTKV
jgi:hypothetical protein